GRRGLAVVRALWQERDRIARQRAAPPTRVLSDAAIIEAARTPPKDAAALTTISGFTGRGARRHAGEWLRAINRARVAADADLPESSAPAGDGPPPAHRWAQRDPEAARRPPPARPPATSPARKDNPPPEQPPLPPPPGP